MDALRLAHIHIVTSNLQRLAMVPDNIADLVYMSHVLEHVGHRELIATVKEMCRVLKKEGVLRISVPDFDKIVTIYQVTGNEVAAIEQPLMGGQNSPFNFHHAVFNKKSLEDLLLKSGFKDVSIWDPDNCSYHDFDDWASRSITWEQKEFPISLNLEAIKT